MTGMFLVKIPEYARAFGVNPGYGQLDEIVPGVSFANSEVGLLAFSIEAFFYRLVCTNGLIAKTSSTVSRFKHISNRGLENFPETLAGVIEDSIRKQDQFKLSRQSPLRIPIRSIESFSQRFGLSQAETEVVRQSYYLEQGGHDVSHHQCLYAGCPGYQSGLPSGLTSSNRPAVKSWPWFNP
jgi:hypothetical protein